MIAGQSRYQTAFHKTQVETSRNVLLVKESDVVAPAWGPALQYQEAQVLKQEYYSSMETMGH